MSCDASDPAPVPGKSSDTDRRPRGAARRQGACALVLGLFATLGAGCAIEQTNREIGSEPPYDRFGRPAFVRDTYRVPQQIGSFVGALASVALFPLTYPISSAAADELGDDKSMMRYPLTSVVSGGAGFMFGAPIDTFDWIFHSAWIDDTTMEPLELQPAPMLPVGTP